MIKNVSAHFSRQNVPKFSKFPLSIGWLIMIGQLHDIIIWNVRVEPVDANVYYVATSCRTDITN